MSSTNPDGDRIAELREEAGLTQVGLAEQCGVSSVTVNRIESGTRRGAPQTRKAIADALSEQLGRTITVRDLRSDDGPEAA